MTPQELSEARQKFGMAKKDFGLLLGYTGELRNIYMTVERMERGTRPISPMVERLVTLLVWFKADYGYLPDLDNGRREPMEMSDIFSEIQPHIYSPDHQAMGDCRVCGHDRDKPWHLFSGYETKEHQK